MKYSTLKLLIVFLIFSNVHEKLFGQKVASDGDYVVMSNGDTLFGKVVVPVSSERIKVVDFQSQVGLSNLDLTDVIGFRSGTRSYRMKHVDLDRSPYITSTVYLDKLDYLDEPRMHRDSLFIEVLIDGPAKLFVSQDGRRTRFFIETDNSLIEELINNQHKVDNDGIIGFQHSERYRGRLEEIFSDCESVSKQTRKLSYDHTSLIGIIESANRCYGYKVKAANVQYKKKPDLPFVDFGVVMGFSSSSLELGSVIDELLEEAEFDNSVTISVGVSALLNLSKKRLRWNVNNELLFKRLNSRGSSSIKVSSFDATTSSMKVDLSRLKLSSTLRYKFYGNDFNYFVGVGLSGGHVLSQSSYRRDQRVLVGRIIESEEDLLPSFGDFELGYHGSIGLEWENFSGEFRYERSDGFSDSFAIGTPVSTLHFLVAYYF